MLERLLFVTERLVHVEGQFPFEAKTEEVFNRKNIILNRLVN
jgi:hypothetical protein